MSVTLCFTLQSKNNRLVKELEGHQLNAMTLGRVRVDGLRRIGAFRSSIVKMDISLENKLSKARLWSKRGVCKKEISTNYDVVGGGGGAEKVEILLTFVPIVIDLLGCRGL
ncbi:hypothetical protein FXO38_35727 [Capsicum annuum]|uniref:Uncharacterized protein n=1 Tax=Capsicum annuum TaxID=4072 RepID=A0A2G2ZI22_CAPAN|nr:hypothetical protein FXO38_35727 [Capsicum annuum]KAF3676758.1 hypothetical protein FXO37_05172 [Capsicum annuum]PHT81640.1 hypothetical protein T459_14655 [Capsicum annuum]